VYPEGGGSKLENSDFSSSTLKIMEFPGKQRAFWLLVRKTYTKHTRILMLRLHAVAISFTVVGEQNCRERGM
jgi:hypothetical protein